MSGIRGKRVLVTRPRAQAGALVERLKAEGAVPVLFPTVEIAPGEDQAALDQAIQRLDEYHWVIFTSVNGVEAFFQRFRALGRANIFPSTTRVAAIGPATARALVEHGIPANAVPAEYIAEAILPELGDVSGKRILLPRADIARKDLYNELIKRGAKPDEISAYLTLPAQPTPESLAELQQGIDIATFTSASTVRGFFKILGANAHSVLDRAQIACIGPITAAAAKELGLPVQVVAQEYTADGLIDALLTYFQTEENEIYGNPR